jgi:LysR family glycine cleavage system transcriptional activator
VTRKLPSLKALRSFEATARHLSFTEAADELHVTPAAIGHQVRALEDYFGQKLLIRSTRKVELTDVARWALPIVSQSFDLLAEASERLMAPIIGPALNLTVEPGFAARWLVQHLEGFQQLYPGRDVRLSAGYDLVDFGEHRFDMGIRFGDGRYPGLKVHRMGLEEVFPVCSPTLMEGPKTIREPNDLRQHTLLHEDWVMPNEQVWPSWKMWLKATSADHVDPNPGPHFSNSALAIQAAVGGQGVALSSTAMVADDMAAGRLVRPFGEQFKTQLETAYFLVYLPEVQHEPKIVAFRDWLLGEYGKTECRSE